MTGGPTRPIAHVYEAAYRGVPNWDIGRPQPSFVRLEEAELVESPVLDLGCGTGELSIYLARLGYEVLGVDLAPTAIAIARRKARWRRVDARFLVWDAVDLAALADAGLAVRTVLDSAMFHVLAPGERDAVVAGLERVLETGGRYVLLGDERRETDRPYGISERELRARFRPEDGWTLEFVHRTALDRRGSWTPALFAGLRHE